MANQYSQVSLSLRAAMLACALAVGQALAAAPARAATSGTPLDRYLGGLSSLRTSFSQTVMDAAGAVIETGKGTLLVQRPGKFRWEYTPLGADAHLLVADGSNLWFYDHELQQATVKPAAAALSATPVVLLSGSAEQVHAAFAIVDVGARESLSWVQVTPRSASADFSTAELAFRGAQLVRLVIHDRLNQTVTLSFTRNARNARIADGELQFTPPAGVDVIGTAQPQSEPP